MTNLQENLLLVPGPTNLSVRVREAMAEPQMSHVGSEFYQSFTEIVQLARYVFKNENGIQFVFTGSGTVGMESAVVSTVCRGDRVLIVDTGYFGRRLTLINQAHGAKADELLYPDGAHATPEDLRKKLGENRYKAVFMTHVETATSVRNDIGSLVEECKKAGVFSIVDSVCGLGGEPLDFDRLGADIVFTCSQKAIAAPPGATLLATSREIQDYFEKRTEPIESYYMNLLRWKPVMDDPKIYLATPAVQVLRALRIALMELKEEGLEARWARHHQLGEMVRKRLSDLGLPLVADAGYRADTTTAFRVKNGTSAPMQKTLEQQHHIVVARGISEDRDRIIRLGHFGILSLDTLSRALDSIAEVAEGVGAVERATVGVQSQH